jgi:hypothetical protein
MSVESALDHLRTGTAKSVTRAVGELTAAAQTGSPDAARHLATLAAAGIGVPQSWARALTYLFAAALAGSESARGQLKALSANRKLAGGNEQAPNYWRLLCASVSIPDWLSPCPTQVLSASPRIVAVAGFLTPPVCDWLIGRGAPATRDLGVTDYDVVILLTRQRIATTVGVPLAALEASRILRRGAGESLGGPDQGVMTFLVYLNAATEKAGDAVYFAGPSTPELPAQRATTTPNPGEHWLFAQRVRDQVGA